MRSLGRWFVRCYLFWLGLAAALALFGCAGQRTWRPEKDHTASVPIDYGAGKKPTADATGYHDP